MSSYFDIVEAIKIRLQAAHQEVIVKQINKGLLVGGTIGEKLDIICSLLRTYEISNPEIFNQMKEPANELLAYAESIGYHPAANFDIFDELTD